MSYLTLTGVLEKNKKKKKKKQKKKKQKKQQLLQYTGFIFVWKIQEFQN